MYAHRILATDPGAVDTWISAHRAEKEQTLMAWTGLPSLAELRALPESPR